MNNGVVDPTVQAPQQAPMTPGGPPISCPHCGAPVRYASPDPPAPPADGTLPVPPAAPSAPPMDESGGDSAGLETLENEQEEQAMAEQTNRDASTETVLDSVDMGDRGPAAEETAQAVKADEEPPEPKITMAEIEALRAENSRLLAANASLEQQVAMKEAADKTETVEAMLARGLKEGKLTPKMIGSDEKPTETRRFAFRDPESFGRWLENDAQIIVDLGERGTSLAETRDSAAGLAEQTDQRARALMEQDKSLDYATATRRVLATDRALSEQYDSAMGGIALREVSVVSRQSSVRNAAPAK